MTTGSYGTSGKTNQVQGWFDGRLPHRTESSLLLLFKMETGAAVFHSGNSGAPERKVVGHPKPEQISKTFLIFGAFTDSASGPTSSSCSRSKNCQVKSSAAWRSLWSAGRSCSRRRMTKALSFAWALMNFPEVSYHPRTSLRQSVAGMFGAFATIRRYLTLLLAAIRRFCLARTLFSFLYSCHAGQAVLFLNLHAGMHLHIIECVIWLATDIVGG